MKYSKSKKTLAALVLAIAAVVIPVSTVAATGAAHVRWDIVSVVPTLPIPPGPFPVTLNAGGVAFAKAVDNSSIKMTGAGTFVAPAGGQGSNSNTAGGGTWETFDPGNHSTGSGTYWVTGLVRWEQAPGANPALSPDMLIDGIGDPNEWSAGLAVLRIEYSDGEKGTLIVNCSFPATPPNVPEGISATKGYVDYFGLQTPVDGVDANRTVFHVRQ